MPNYLAHEYFGAKIAQELRGNLGEAVFYEQEAFRAGLYGPDPMIFSPLGIYASRFLHSNWGENKTLHRLLQNGTKLEKSFVAGYFCHLMLDDICHPHIYELMAEEKMSHYQLEVGLDCLVRDTIGDVKFKGLDVSDRSGISRLAGGLLLVKPNAYRFGFATMNRLCRNMNSFGKLYSHRYEENYCHEVENLFAMLEAGAEESFTHLCYLEECGGEQLAFA